MLIEDRHYRPELVNHVLNIAPNLKVLRFTYRKKFHVDFIRIFLSVRKDKPLVYKVPEDSVEWFQAVTEYERLDNITISSDANTELVVERDTITTPEHVDSGTITTPEHVDRHVQMIKRKMKRSFFLHW